MQPTIIGLDLAKHVFQLHGVDSAGNVIVRKQLRRSELKAFFAKRLPCVVAMEACVSAHYWGRELSALGHEIRLMPAVYVKPYVKRGKNDEVDAEAPYVTCRAQKIMCSRLRKLTCSRITKSPTRCWPGASTSSTTSPPRICTSFGAFAAGRCSISTCHSSRAVRRTSSA